MPERSTKIKSQAALLGYFGKSTENLTNSENSKIDGRLYHEESSVNESIGNLGEKIKEKNMLLNYLMTLYKQHPFMPDVFFAGLLTILLYYSMMVISSHFIDPLLMPIIACAGFIGGLIIYYKPDKKPTWKPILFMMLALTASLIFFRGLYMSGIEWLSSALASIIMTVAIYVTNSIIIKSLKDVFKQCKTGFISLRIKLNQLTTGYFKRRYTRANKKLDSILGKKENMKDRSSNTIRDQYQIGETLKEVKSISYNSVNKNKPVINRRIHTYAR